MPPPLKSSKLGVVSEVRGFYNHIPKPKGVTLKAASKIVNNFECNSLTFHISALLVEPDIDDLELPTGWVKTGEEFQEELESADYVEELSELAAETNPDWDDELDGIIFIDAKFTWDVSNKHNFSAGQKLIQWLNHADSQENILSAILVNQVD